VNKQGIVAKYLLSRIVGGVMKFNRVLIATDLDQTNIRTLSQLEKMQLAADTEIHLIHVFEFKMLNFENLPNYQVNKNDIFTIERLLLQKLEELKNELKLDRYAKVITKCLVSVGAKQEFLQYADQVKPDLIIAAAGEKTPLRGFFEGSFTSFLNKFSRYNLLILRPA
jgi:nucleotide-binding universal stress UspA family protein